MTLIHLTSLTFKLVRENRALQHHDNQTVPCFLCDASTRLSLSVLLRFFFSYNSEEEKVSSLHLLKQTEEPGTQRRGGRVVVGTLPASH